MLEVFWYDIDFDEDPYQPQKRFDGNFERRSDSEPAKAQGTRGERPQRGVRSEYDAREPRQKFGGDLRSSRSGSSEVYPRPARATPEASWRPAVRSRRNGEDEDDYYYEEEKKLNRVRDGSSSSSSSDGSGKKRSRKMSTDEARKNEVALRLAELEEDAKDLEEKTLACEEKLAVVNVNQALWGRRLQASGGEMVVHVAIVMVVRARQKEERNIACCLG